MFAILMLIMSLKIDIHETYSLTTTSFTLYRYFMLLATASRALFL